MIRKWPLLFIIIPLMELYVIISVGEEIGALWTVVLVLLTAIIGVNLLRIQGMSTLMRAQRNMAQGAVPAMEMLEGVILALGGVLLITPGFITDTIGFLCLIPYSRRAVIRYIMEKSSVQTSFNGQPPPGYQQQPPGAEPPPKSSPRSSPRSPSGSPPKAPAKVGRTFEGEYRRDD